jgi:hypothetical protein
LTQIRKSGLQPVLKPKETHPKEGKMRKLQGLSKIECYKRELDKFSGKMKRMTAKDTFKANAGSYEGFSEQYVQEVLEKLSSHQEMPPSQGRSKMTSRTIVHH